MLVLRLLVEQVIEHITIRSHQIKASILFTLVKTNHNGQTSRLIAIIKNNGHLRITHLLIPRARCTDCKLQLFLTEQQSMYGYFKIHSFHLIIYYTFQILHKFHKTQTFLLSSLSLKKASLFQKKMR